MALTALAPHTEEEAGDSGGKSDPGKAGCAALTDLVTNEVKPPPQHNQNMGVRLETAHSGDP